MSALCSDTGLHGHRHDGSHRLEGLVSSHLYRENERENAMKDRIEAMTLVWAALLLALAIADVLLPDRADRFGAAHVCAAMLAGGAIVVAAVTIRSRLRLGARKRLVSMRRKAKTAVRHVVTS